jgi:hypothetical protein
MLLGVFRERFLLRSVPVLQRRKKRTPNELGCHPGYEVASADLVEATFDFVGEMLGPDGGKRSETTRSFDVTDDTDDDHRRGLDDGDSFDDLSLVHLGPGSVEITKLRRRD